MSTRQIKDAVNHSTGELVYFKSHAKATFMSDGKTVEEAINNIELPTVPTKVSELTNDSGYITDAEINDSIMWVKAEGESGVRLKGTNGTATGNLAISAGDDKTASDGTLFTSEASGDHAVAFGYGNTCAGRTTLAQGLYNTVNGKDSVAFGQRNLVDGDQAFAAGQQNEVTTRLGVAIGYKNKTTNTDSIAIGYQNTSSGSASVAMGDTCEANGTSSTAMGYKTKATGAYSSTFGENTQATNKGEVAMGKYNKSTTSTNTSEQTAFSFGIGTSDTNRVNAFEIKKNGDVYIGDKLLSEEYVTETELNDKGFLTEHQDISHLASRNWVESQGYAHQEDLLEISFNDIQDSPISIDDSGMINFVDESGNVGFQINEEGLRVTDVIAGEHKLSEKANISDIPSLDGYAKTEDIPSLDDYASKEWVNNKNYATEYDLKNIDYSSINNVPVSEDETGELNITDENGNIGMKVASEAVYAKDFVAGEHKLSEKVDKTYVDNSIAELVDGAPETLDTLNELAAALHDNADIVDVLNQSIGNKQDAITDLETIRQGAAKGATALQSYTEQYKGTVTGVKINGTTKNPSNGVVDLGTVITSHQDISGKQDKLVSGTNIKTINGTSILGSGNITISGGSSSGSGAYAEVNHGTSDTTFALTPNTFHVWEEVSALTLTLGSETSGVANEYLFQFISGATATTLSLPSDLKWANDTAPTIEPNMIYQVSILKGLASVLSWDNTPDITLINFTVDNTSFNAESGMLWSEWTASNYNTSGYIKIVGNKVQNAYTGDNLFTTSGVTVSSSDDIQPIKYTFTNPWS